MKLAKTAALLGLVLAAHAAAAAAATAQATEKEAVALVEKGAAVLRTEGKARMIERINAKDPAFYLNDGALYLHMRDAKTAVMLAHPANPALIGKDLLDAPDTNGKYYRREIVELAATKGKGWVDYTYKNPASGKIEPKTTYILRVGDVTLEAGIYKN
ncbi:cache domain-containing protein [Massilia oculi]|uniref:Cache domain-containing protein n=1 Tax=Massilia hydrophila TaxID=3044279 RepID=A0ABS7YG73_9BURK|nr:cache domain-containing protein [Massilia oculi]MCA1857330.1 cache domain-containing protein [Massilia oculi]